jgi:hypothetical protein
MRLNVSQRLHPHLLGSSRGRRDTLARGPLAAGDSGLQRGTQSMKFKKSLAAGVLAAGLAVTAVVAAAPAQASGTVHGYLNGACGLWPGMSSNQLVEIVLSNGAASASYSNWASYYSLYMSGGAQRAQLWVRCVTPGGTWWVGKPFSYNGGGQWLNW